MPDIHEDNISFSVLIPDGESSFVLSVLQCLGKVKNVKIYVLSNEPWGRIRFSRYINHFFSYPKEEGDERRLVAINDIVKKKKIDIILPVEQQAIRLFSRNSETLSKLTSIVHLPKTEAFDIARNKWWLAEWLKKNHIPSPPTVLYQSNVKFEETLSTLSFPVLLKPIFGSGGNGIKYFENASALNRYCKERPYSNKFIVQSYINGYDISCSLLCRNGQILAHTIQKRVTDEALNFRPTTDIDFYYDSCTYNVVKEVVDKLNWDGIVNFDLRYDEQDKQVKVIEMNPRYWGSLLGSLSAGVNFPYLACLSGLSHDFPEMSANPIRFVHGKTTIRHLVRGFFHKNKSTQYYDKSNLEYSFRDPFPAVIAIYLYVYKQIKKKIAAVPKTFHA
ncbi:MAG: ATP-grasp domain-containing protein [Bacteroidetes bacterium]|nr:ATP-grasp domain-containing protein [Bacteroidota bacterium]